MKHIKDTYTKTKVLTFPNMVATVHFPDLSEEERQHRMKAIHKAAAALLKERK